MIIITEFLSYIYLLILSDHFSLTEFVEDLEPNLGMLAVKKK